MLSERRVENERVSRRHRHRRRLELSKSPGAVICGCCGTLKGKFLLATCQQDSSGVRSARAGSQ